MVFGPGGRDHDSPNQLYLILGTPRYFKKYKKNTKYFWEILDLDIAKFWKVGMFEKIRKDGGRKGSDDPANKFLQMLNIYLQENMTCENLEDWINIFRKA